MPDRAHEHTDRAQNDTDVPDSTDTARRARISRDSTDAPLGAAVFLTAADLERLGVDPDAAERVAYTVQDGELRLAPHSTGEENSDS
jgi:hypothetical protein